VLLGILELHLPLSFFLVAQLGSEVVASVHFLIHSDLGPWNRRSEIGCTIENLLAWRVGKHRVFYLVELLRVRRFSIVHSARVTHFHVVRHPVLDDCLRFQFQIPLRLVPVGVFVEPVHVVRTDVDLRIPGVLLPCLCPCLLRVRAQRQLPG